MPSQLFDLTGNDRRPPRKNEMPNAQAVPRATRKLTALNYWARQSGLDGILDEFLIVTEGPANGRCLITNCEHIQRTINELGFWSGIEPFNRWILFIDEVLKNSAFLQQNVGSHLYPERRENEYGEAINSFRGKIQDYPISAMLSDEHQYPRLRVQYGSLHLHVILARWLEAGKTALKIEKSGAGKQITPIEVLKFGRDHETRIRLTDHIAKTVRDLSRGSFGPLLEHIKPNLEPEEFRKHLRSIKQVPLGDTYEEHFKVIRHWCLKHSGARVGGHHAPADNVDRRPTFAEYVGYGDLRLGVNLPVEEEGQPSRQSILNRRGSDDETFQLGLHPLERTGGDATIRSDVEGAGNAGEATAIARSSSRHFEINRRLFPWSNDHLRLEEFRRGILPALVRACDSDSRDELEIAALLAIMIDTGREADAVLAISIEKNPNKWLCYQGPATPKARGAYYWAAIEPMYKTARTADAEKELPRATYLRFPASTLASRLVEKHLEKAKVGSGKMFRREKDYKKALSDWIKSHDCTGRATARRLANLRWESLHRITGGDLATCCLTLGIGESIAAVELHYAVLHVSEAREKYERSSRELWREHFGEAPVDYDDVSHEEATKIIGIRAFPKIEIIRGVVTGLRAGSREFFAVPAKSFDFAKHAELLNRAVLYATWHQMHAFATRAICDAYQERSLFSTDGISTLRDKDFEDGHKARMVWADPMLLTHMEAIEQRLDEIQTKTSDKEFPENGSLWFIADDGTIEEITPTTIAKHLGAAFPFPANTPRKVMRYLVRVRGDSPEERLSGLSYEEAEVFMGHWWQSREPWSPFSSFDWGAYLANIEHLIPAILTNLGFIWPPEVSVE